MILRSLDCRWSPMAVDRWPMRPGARSCLLVRTVHQEPPQHRFASRWPDAPSNAWNPQVVCSTLLQYARNCTKTTAYLSRHDHEKVLPLPLLASGVRSGCFRVSWGVSCLELCLSQVSSRGAVQGRSTQVHGTVAWNAAAIAFSFGLPPAATIAHKIPSRAYLFRLVCPSPPLTPFFSPGVFESTT